MDFCEFDTFTDPSDITPLVFSLTGFSVTPDNVPTTGLTSDEVKGQVIKLAVDPVVGFFPTRLVARQSEDERPFTDLSP